MWALCEIFLPISKVENHLASLPPDANFAGGTNFTSADFMMIFPLEGISARDPELLGPRTIAWVDKIHSL